VPANPYDRCQTILVGVPEAISRGYSSYAKSAAYASLRGGAREPGDRWASNES